MTGLALLVTASVGCAGCAPAASPEPASPTPSATASFSGGPGIGPVPTSTPTDVSTPDPDVPAPDPAFTAQFADPLYLDEGNELAPFGSDEGFDTLHSWAEHPQDLTGCTTVRSMFAEEDGSLAAAMEDASGEDPAAAGAVVGVGFTLLYYTGHVDTEGKQLVLDAIRREARYYDDDSLRPFPVLLRDLTAFPATDCPP